MWDITMFRKKIERPMGTCARCGAEVTNGDWIKYCHSYRILGEGVILHFCKVCWECERRE